MGYLHTTKTLALCISAHKFGSGPYEVATTGVRVDVRRFIMSSPVEKILGELQLQLTTQQGLQGYIYI